VFPRKTEEFSIDVDLISDMAVINPFDFFLEPYAANPPSEFPPELHGDVATYEKPAREIAAHRQRRPLLSVFRPAPRIDEEERADLQLEIALAKVPRTN
jgi:hypothetical protein